MPISGSSTGAACCRRRRATTFPSFWPSPSWPRIPSSTGWSASYADPAPKVDQVDHRLSCRPAAGRRVRRHFGGLPAGAESQPAAADHAKGPDLHAELPAGIATRSTRPPLPRSRRTCAPIGAITGWSMAIRWPRSARKYHTSSVVDRRGQQSTGEERQGRSEADHPDHARTQRAREPGAYSKHPTHYKVRKGDTVASVADDFEVPVEKLRKWNHLRGSALTPDGP